MSSGIQLNLALILFLPWFAILGTLYWLVPRTPRPAARKTLDVVALLAAVLAFVASVHWAYRHADPAYGSMWKQVLATAVGYAVFLAVLAVAFFLRRAWLRRH
ncbi:MAG: hypothetical protein AVDCRST_MAG71-1232 [uncultured Lysobacter sp.]|uniref:Transmembrane protein n=1 Tax=uncultured Lysobacter sp. TaxID=271060 RepID=A0A6J4L232_9GAMM|nr:MAG: hypothetical protein AVDCRST_MAG71-1232 [uncultured Lysobacter sp.]